jgi:CheY-like chemotaxis protein
MATNTQQPVGLRILVVEDNPADVELAQLGLSRIDPECSITVALNGEQAISLFENSDKGDFSPFDLILLDLNLPRFDGFEVLKVIRSHRQINSPVVMFSTSFKESDKKKALDLGANETVTKPRQLEEVFEAFAEIVSKWCSGKD